MDRIAEKLAGWFGSTPFILFHMLWYSTWSILHFTVGLDKDWELLTIIVSLEAIFLALFILRAENIQSERFEKYIKEARDVSKKDLDSTQEVIDLITKK